MTERRKNNPAMRILLALDASPHGQAAIDAAASLAADMRAELLGLFVEDINLLRVADLPFTREVDEASAALRPLDISAMEQALRVKAVEVRQAMATKAEELRVRWSFQVTRGEFVRSTLAAATQADLLVLTREGRTPRNVRRVETAPIVVAYDGSSSGADALQTAATLVQRLGGPLVILIVAENVDQRESVYRSLTVWLQEQNLIATIDDLAIQDAKALVQVARQWEGRALVVNRDCPLLDETTIGSLVDELMHPVVLVG